MELAFMPGYPWLIRKIEIIFSLLAAATGWLNRSDCFVLAAISISLVSFVGSSLVLFRLLEQWKVPFRIKQLALWIHLLNPANIFFTTAYTESLYSMLSWLGILLIERGEYSLAWVPILAASCTRTNGILNVLFPVTTFFSCATKGRDAILSTQMITLALRFAPAALSSILPFVAFDILNHRQICDIRNVGKIFNEQEWIQICSKIATTYTFHGTYSIVQRKHWDVGLFRYYQLKQIPNFLLAFPILFVASSSVVFSAINNTETLRFAVPIQSNLGGSHFVHLWLHILISVTWAHVQISTRLICSACPIIYVYYACLLDKSRGCNNHSLNIFLLLFMFGYNFAGIVLHSNWFPWT